ncbi:MAG: exodeoxyribonuclease V subunit gamma, partial [Planctomycetia bacterium]|nr:exodeoxyribonuclease V subunit gamma [Planctomycetia bacterium]
LIRVLLGRARPPGEADTFATPTDPPGLATALDGFVGELKRGRVLPDEFSRAVLSGRAAGDKDRALAQLYRQYQQRLQELDLYDDEGRFWRVRELLAEGRFGPFADIELAVVDGFQDFTAAQADILELLSGRCRRMVFTLTLEADRRELFAVTRRTLRTLERMFEGRIEIQEMDDGGELPADLEHLRKNLFAVPGSTAPARAEGQVRIIAAAGVTRETEAVARRIKHILLAGDVQPGRIAVLVRSFGAYEDVLREVFPRYGIRFSMSEGLPLLRCPAVRAALAALDIPASNFARRDVIKLLKSVYFDPKVLGFEREDVEAVDRLTREASVFEGMESYFSGLRWLKSTTENRPREAQEVDDEPEADEIAEKLSSVDRAELFLKAFFDLYEDFPTSGVRREIVRRLRVLLQALRLDARPAGAGAIEDEDLLLRRDMLSLQRFAEVMDELCGFGDGDSEVTLEVFRRELLAALAEVRIPAYSPPGAPVVVLDVLGCRALSFEHVFLM